MFFSINPADGSREKVADAFSTVQLEDALQQAAVAVPGWQSTVVADRAALMRKAAEVLRARSEEYARLMTCEMGKPLGEARAEIGKCALAC